MSVETVCRTRKGTAALDHVALVLIFSDEAMPFASLRIDHVAGRAFASEAEALMGGYSIVDKLVAGGELMTARIASGAI
ncbi:hypothetical protein PWP93_31965 [Paraburkholderia sp. A1RI-2L]|uniref:hypothetical protein n=1 Tax=Paraburkholderia sp. A1RI-2L TaxID=3028367 RepID=UPI003B81150C